MFAVMLFNVDNAVCITLINFLVTEQRKSDIMLLSLLIKTPT
jgi:hypothetical protein